MRGPATSPARPHLLAVSRTARRLDRAIAALWRNGVTARPPLEPGYLWAVGSRGYDAADEAGGRSAEEVADFRERLEVLCRSLREEAQLNALGHTLAYGQLTAAIRRRHALGGLWRQRPGLARTPHAPPIVVVGQMRSGTTRVHRLLAADPRFAGTRFCNAHDPVPRRPDWRPVKAVLALALARRINPWLDALHPFGATRPDEEIGWLAGALSPCAFEAQWRIPAFVAWSEARDPAPVYREFARILATDAATMGNAERPRVLKCPQFAEDLAMLVRAFPVAPVVLTRRDAADVLASTVSLVAAQSAFQSDCVTLEAIEREWRRKIALREQRMTRDVAATGVAAFTVDFAAMDRDPHAVTSALHDFLGGLRS